MKKILFAIAIVMMIGFTASAQRGTDGFFGSYNDDSYGNRGISDLGLPTLQNEMGSDPTPDPTVPLGTGLLILTALGAGYAVARKKK